MFRRKRKITQTLHKSERDECGKPKAKSLLIGSFGHDGDLSSEAETAVITPTGSMTESEFTVQGLYNRRYLTKEEKATKPKREQFLVRKRMNTRPLGYKNDDDDEEYEIAMFVPGRGLTTGFFWHEYDAPSRKEIIEDRAILFQAEEHYDHLAQHPKWRACFEGFDYKELPTFGEQVRVSGIHTSDLAVGDIFEIEGGCSPLVVEVTAPRKPCTYINNKHGSKHGAAGMRNYVLAKNLGGWFARVLIAGELREGMKFVRTSQPNPKWTLDYINKALYGEGNRFRTLACKASWSRTRCELQELINLIQLGEYEWKEEAREIAEKLDAVNLADCEC